MKQYKEFQERVKVWLQQYYGRDWNIELESVTGNNGIVKDSLLIQKQESGNPKIINLDPFYKIYQQGVEITFICWALIKSLDRGYPLEGIQEETLLDFGKMADRVIYRLINADLNRELLKTIPSLPFNDLAIVFALLLDSPEEREEDDQEEGRVGREEAKKENQEDDQEYSQASCLIHYGHLKLWGIPEELLYPLAMENTPRLLPIRYQSIVDVIGKEAAEAIPGDEPEMYVVTNQTGIYGAAVALYPGALENIAGRLGTDLLILPSSVNELILIPYDERSEGVDFWEMVSEINQTEVPPEDILSESVYRYDRKKDRVVILKREETRV